MPNVVEEFPHLNDLTQDQLYQRRTSLIGSAPQGDYKQLTDDALKELVVIARVLRRRTSAPTSAGKKVAPSLGML